MFRKRAGAGAVGVILWSLFSWNALDIHAQDYDIIGIWDFENRNDGRYTEDQIIEDFNPYNVDYIAPVDIVTDEINGLPTKAMRITNWANDLWHGFEMTYPVNGSNELYLSYNWKFGENWNSTHGGKLTGFETYPLDPEIVNCPGPGYGFLCSVNFSEGNKIYTYHYDNTEKGWDGCPWSTIDYRFNEVWMSNGSWYNITERIVLNTFSGEVPNADGIFEVWVDGRIIYQQNNLRFLGAVDPGMTINGIFLANYFGGSGFNYIPQTECFGYIDNITVYTPNNPIVTGNNLHDPEIILNTPATITDRRVYYDWLVTENGPISNSEWGDYHGSCIDEAHLIDAGEGNTVLLTVDSYEIGGGDYMFFYDGNTTDAPLIRKFDGYAYGGQEIIESTGRYLFVRFSVDTDNGTLGWSGTVSQLDGVEKPPDLDPPSVPDGLQTTSVDVRSVSFSWDAASDNEAVTGYRIYKNGSLVTSTTQTFFTLDQLIPATTYDITVTAFDAASNESNPSTALSITTLQLDTDAPSVPQGLQVLGESGNSVTLSWEKSEDNVNVAGYNIYVDGEYHKETTDLSTTVTGLAPNTSFVFTVTAFDVVPNESGASLPVIGTTTEADNQAPTTPSGVTATNITSHSISIEWNGSTDNVGVSGYHVYANGLLKGTAFTNSYTITQLNPGITYNIEVSAYDDSQNESPKSAVLTEKTVNPDAALDPTMPSVRTVELTKGIQTAQTVSELTALGHTELEDYGVLFSEDLATLESGPVYGDPADDSVAHDNRVTAGLQLLYDFSEGRGNQVLDISDSGDPFHLTINRPLNTYWLPGQGLRVAGNNTLLSNDLSPTRVNEAMALTDEITVEAWIKPEELNQSGPARIFTLSSGSESRAFTLGHEGSVSDFEYAIRLNTTDQDNENGLPEVVTDQDFFSIGLHHVVYTRDALGEEILYVNRNKMYEGTRTGELGTWTEDFRFALANELNEERQWNGTYYLVALYNRALTTTEVEDNYDAGFGQLHFTADLESLETNTTYYLAPFVRTDQGIVYGEVQNFMIQNILDFDGGDSLEMAIVPNPSDGSFTLSFEDGSNEDPTGIIRIADMSGQVIYTEILHLGENLTAYEQEFDLGDLMRSGIYSVMLILGTKSKSQRLIILRD